MPQNDFSPKKMQEIVDDLKKQGKMPPLDKVLEVMAEVREEYQPKIEAAREGKVPVKAHYRKVKARDLK